MSKTVVLHAPVENKTTLLRRTKAPSCVVGSYTGNSGVFSVRTVSGEAAIVLPALFHKNYFWI